MSHKVYFTIPLDRTATDVLKANGCEAVVATGHSEDVYLAELKAGDYEGIMCRTEPITAAMMDACPNLKVIGKQGVGYDNIDVEAATKRGIQVVFAPGGNSNAVAEHTVFLLLACARRFNYVDGIFRKGNFGVRYGLHNTFELEGMTLGLIGCGRIGQSIAKCVINGFGMKVIGYDPYAKPENMSVEIELKETLEEVFAESDFVSLHLPSTPSTKHSIGMDYFKLMKPTASFINASRGDVIIEEDLIEALDKKLIMGAGLDVFEQEPLPMDSPLMKMSSVIATAHTAATTEQSVRKCCEMVAGDIADVLQGKTAKYPVNKLN